jgi:hypothetical protein
MSEDQLSFWSTGNGGENTAGAKTIRASIAREIQYLLTISTETGGRGHISPAGLAHSLGVCILEDWLMARGKGRTFDAKVASAMPRFVDVKLSEDERKAFQAKRVDVVDASQALQSFADNGYRVGISWSGEQQAYTVSVTCRDADSPNNGLCMTSFSKTLIQAVNLAWYKHVDVCRGIWPGGADKPMEDFG